VEGEQIRGENENEGEGGLESDSDEEATDQGEGRKPKPSLKVLSINVSGINDPGKRRALFTWLRLQRADIILLSETHLADQAKIPFWQAAWARRGGGPEGASWWAVSSSPHTGGTAVLMRPNLPAKILGVEREEGGHGRWVRVRAMLDETEFVWQAVYAPAEGPARVRWIADPAWRPPTSLARHIIGGDLNCVEDAARDTVNRPEYGNAGGRECADASAALGWCDAWLDQRRAKVGSGMTFWRGVGGSRIDRIYVDSTSGQQILRAWTCVWAQSDHLAIACTLSELGARGGPSPSASPRTET